MPTDIMEMRLAGVAYSYQTREDLEQIIPKLLHDAHRKSFRMTVETPCAPSNHHPLGQLGLITCTWEDAL